MSDQLRELVTPVGEFEPPLDLHTRIVARERELVVSRRPHWRPPRALMIAVAAAGVALLIVVLAVAAHSRSSAPGPANGPGQHQARFAGMPDCANSDMAPTFEIRRPSHRQDIGVFKAKSHNPVVSIVVRNVSSHRCHGRTAFRFKILDSRGHTVGSWDDQGDWFDADYQPGASRAFSLPNVYSCNKPGPFSAVAAVHGHIIHRHNLNLSEITC